MQETAGKGSPLSTPSRQLSIAGVQACSTPTPWPPAKTGTNVCLARPTCTRHKARSGGQCWQTSLRNSTHQPSLFLVPAAQDRPISQNGVPVLHRTSTRSCCSDIPPKGQILADEFPHLSGTLATRFRWRRIMSHANGGPERFAAKQATRARATAALRRNCSTNQHDCSGRQAARPMRVVTHTRKLAVFAPANRVESYSCLPPGTSLP